MKARKKGKRQASLQGQWRSPESGTHGVTALLCCFLGPRTLAKWLRVSIHLFPLRKIQKTKFLTRISLFHEGQQAGNLNGSSAHYLWHRPGAMIPPNTRVGVKGQYPLPEEEPVSPRQTQAPDHRQIPHVLYGPGIFIHHLKGSQGRIFVHPWWD